jgi:hypothetical protein
VIPRATQRLPLSLMAAFTTAIAVAGCGSAAGPGAPTSGAGAPTSAPGSTPTANQTAAGAGDSGGVADTPSNPDRTYICAAAAMNSGGQTIAYLTVAGSDTTAGQTECSTVAQSSGWTAATTSPFHENLYTPECFINFDMGRLTARIYTSDTATFADGLTVCNPLLHGFGLATLPPG